MPELNRNIKGIAFNIGSIDEGILLLPDGADINKVQASLLKLHLKA